jgi:hypothetical protein
MTLHLTRVAYGCTSLAMLVDVVAQRSVGGLIRLSTRYAPKRQAEIIGGGSLYWIIKHQLVARAMVVGFEDAPDGRHDICLAPHIIPVRSAPRRAHQGWRYLESGDAPPDLAVGELRGDPLPPGMISELAALSLI